MKRTRDKTPFRVELLKEGVWVVSGSIPGQAQALGQKKDQVRKRYHSLDEANKAAAYYQQQRLAALQLKKSEATTLHLAPTVLDEETLRSAEAAARRIKEKADPRPITELVEIGMSIKPPGKNIPLADAAKVFLYEKFERLTSRGYWSLAGHVNKFLKYCGGHPTEQICRAWMQSDIDANGTKPTPTTQINRRTAARNFTNWCLRRKILIEDPWANVPPPMFRPDDEESRVIKTVKILSLDQFRALINAAATYYNGSLLAYTLLGTYAGLRPSEIARLKREHIQPDGIHVWGKVRRVRGERETRLVPIEPVLAEFLRQIDWETQVMNVDKFRKRWDLVRERAGLKDGWDPDAMRHSYVAYRNSRGDDPVLVARHAGHDAATGKIYYDRHVPKEEADKFFDVNVAVDFTKNPPPLDERTAQIAKIYKPRRWRTRMKTRVAPPAPAIPLS